MKKVRFPFSISHFPSGTKCCPMRSLIWLVGAVLSFIICHFSFSACARMGNPDGGWYDETPPRVVSASPEDRSTGVKTQRMSILFDEYIKVENPTEKVVVSPPQLEMPEIQGAGRQIKIHLLDSLKPNTTYTIDFSDAISDNNEGNPMGNFTYSFSTGDHIDTLEVSGYVLNAENLEPVKGILVGLYSNLSDTIFRHEPMLRVSRTDSRGHFVIKGVAEGEYRIYGLEDADRNYVFNQKSERIAFSHDLIKPSWKPDVRQDTIWRDSLHIDSIMRVPYTHFLPDDIVLRAFTEKQTDRALLKSERKYANRFTLFYSYGGDSLPNLRGLNFDSTDAWVVEPSLRRDTLTYWLRDSLLINQDTLQVEVSHYITDTLGVLTHRLDTLTLLSKEPFERRQKLREKEIKDWEKQQEKARKRGDSVETQMPVKPLGIRVNSSSQMAPDVNPTLSFETPIAVMDTSKIHLYSQRDTLWYRSPFLLRPHPTQPRTFEVVGEWRPEVSYSLETDSAAFIDIYGTVADATKTGFKVASNTEFATIFVTLSGLECDHVVAELLNSGDKPVKTARAVKGNVEFFYVKPGEYYLRCFEDFNDNGEWDTGDYDNDQQAETVYYYPEKIECKANWDLSLPTWQPALLNPAKQKPNEIKQQKADKEKTIRRRNAARARELGIEYVKEKIPY